MAILEVQNVEKIYSSRLGTQQVRALNKVSFSVEAGEYVAIMGESGSGKTTLLNILAALDKPTGGKVLLEGRDLGGLHEKEISAFRRDNLGFVFQDFNLLDTFTLQDNIFLPLVLAGRGYKEMARRMQPGRRRVVLAGSLHPEYRAVVDTYTEAQGIELTTVPWDVSGRVDAAALATALTADVCALVVQSPNVFGVVEDLPAVAGAAKGAGALAIQVVAEATSLGLLAPGGRFGFDVVCGELQAFGIPPAFGGPHLGFFAAKQSCLRQMPGRLVGETVDADGKRGFVLTLSTREQHIRRAKATSNICTNHGLMALAATIVLSLLGKKGVGELARSSHAVAEYLKAGLRGLGTGVRLHFPEGVTYNEFLVACERPDELLEKLQHEGILGGVSTMRLGGSLPTGILIAATEKNTKTECDSLLDALRRLS